jgi:simple sugar transport system permease protein
MKADLRQMGLTVAAPFLAIVFALIVTTAILLAAGDPVGAVWETIFSIPKPRNMVNIINSGSVLYLSALAAAVGFRMNLFNIGVDGQYRIAAFVAAWVAGEAWLPGFLNVILAVFVAMCVGAMWAGIAGLLRVTRGVSEVISTPIPESSRLKGFDIIPGATNTVYTMALLAVLAGVFYWLLLGRTRFGFSLRATGQSESAAVAAGISVRRMTVYAMLISGAIAGLIGMPLLFGDSYSYGVTFQPGLGFAGIAVALLGRNHPIGIGFGALLFAFLNEQANPLQIRAGVSDEIVNIIQGVIVLSVVIAYEVVRRVNTAAEQRKVAQQLAEAKTTAPTPEGVS